MKDSENQKTVSRGVLQFLLDFYLKVLQRLVIYSLDVCVYMLNKVIMINDAGISVKSVKDKKSPEESIQKVNCSKNWVRIYVYFLVTHIRLRLRDLKNTKENPFMGNSTI